MGPVANAAGFNEMYDLRFFIFLIFQCLLCLNSALCQYLSIFILRLAAAVHISVCLKVGICLRHELLLINGFFFFVFTNLLLFSTVCHCPELYFL